MTKASKTRMCKKIIKNLSGLMVLLNARESFKCAMQQIYSEAVIEYSREGEGLRIFGVNCACWFLIEIDSVINIQEHHERRYTFMLPDDMTVTLSEYY